jgi:energy-coupling factor transport system permease protein
VTLTTSPVALTDGLTLLAAPLRRLRVPVDDLAMMLSIALRFIPTIMIEAQAIIKAQTARGAQFSFGPLTKRLRAWTVILVPLLVQLFRRADVLALAMEARCYTGVGRSRLRVLRLTRADWLVLICVGALLAGLVVAKIFVR